MADNELERPDRQESQPAEPDASEIADLGRQALFEKFGDIWLKASSDEPPSEKEPPPDSPLPSF